MSKKRKRAPKPAVPTPRWLSTKRFRPSSVPGPRSILEQALSDRGRVLFCASFRRLHQKTQVFALEPNDSVRTRLIHSLEVAHNGMFIVDSAFRLIDAFVPDASASALITNWRMLILDQRLAIRTFVEVAGLVHDIGNPPFGHFGEKAICRWFEQHREDLQKQFGAQNKALFEDFVKFDGNKQGFRILTRLQRNMGDKHGLNLTHTQLASTIKYPTPTPEGKGSVFESERDLKQAIWEELGIEPTERHPLSLMMEAADDIAYYISDIEDAHEKGLILNDDLTAIFGPDRTKDKDESRRFTRGRTRITRNLVVEAAREFVERLAGAKDGGMDTSRSLFNKKQRTLADLRSLSNKKIYSSRIVLTNEVTASKVITGLLDAFGPLLSMSSNDFLALSERFSKQQSIYSDQTKQIVKGLTAEPSLLALFPKKHLSAYLDATKRSSIEIFHRVHLIVDFIAGMTDDFALRTYRLLSGQRTYAANR